MAKKIILKWSDIEIKSEKVNASRINCSVSAAHCSYFVH